MVPEREPTSGSIQSCAVRHLWLSQESVRDFLPQLSCLSVLVDFCSARLLFSFSGCFHFFQCCQIGWLQEGGIPSCTPLPPAVLRAPCWEQLAAFMCRSNRLTGTLNCTKARVAHMSIQMIMARSFWITVVSARQKLVGPPKEAIEVVLRPRLVVVRAFLQKAQVQRKSLMKYVVHPLGFSYPAQQRLRRSQNGAATHTCRHDKRASRDGLA